MRKSISLSIVSFLIVSTSLIGQNKSTGSITGEGEVVKKEITLETIDGINLGFNGNVVLTPGSPQKIVIEGQQNIIDNIRREVNGGKWNIYFIKHVREAKPLTVYITVPTLEELGLSGSGNISSTGKFSDIDEIEISVSGSGEITFEYEAKETDVNLSGSGKINLSGTTAMLDISISGSGDVFASQLTASKADVSISGSGNARVRVNGDLETSISGSGDVQYTGNASVVAHISGSGKVSKL